MDLCQYLLNVFTPFPLTVAHRQHPTHPSRVDDIIAAPALTVTLHTTAGLHLPPKKPTSIQIQHPHVLGDKFAES